MVMRASVLRAPIFSSRLLGTSNRTGRRCRRPGVNALAGQVCSICGEADVDAVYQAGTNRKTRKGIRRRCDLAVGGVHVGGARAHRHGRQEGWVAEAGLLAGVFLYTKVQRAHGAFCWRSGVSWNIGMRRGPVFLWRHSIERQQGLSNKKF